MRSAPRARSLSLLVGAAWFLPALVVLANGPRRVATCALDPQGNVQVGQPHNGFCELPTDGTVRVAMTLALVAAGVLLVRRRRRRAVSGG